MGEGNATKVEGPNANAARVAPIMLAMRQPVSDSAFRAVILAHRLGAAGRRLAYRLTAFPSTVATAWGRERDCGNAFPAVPIFIGVGAWSWYALARDPPLVPLIVTLLACGVVAVALRYRHVVLSFAACVTFLLLLGMLLSTIESWRLSTILLDQPVTTMIEGQVLSREADDRGRIRYRVALLSTNDPKLQRPPVNITLLARSPHTPLPIGGGISGRARLSPPSGPALAGLNDFAFDAYFAGTGAIGFFYGKPTAFSLPTGGTTAFAAASRIVAVWRNAITEHIRSRIGGDAGAIAAALITADQRSINPQTIEALRQAGLAHVLAISGLNMALAAGTFLVGARLLLALVPGAAEQFPVKKIAAVGGLVTVTFYILISGGAISAIRSWLMIVVMLIAVLLDRAAISMRNVALSALIILAVTPSAVTGPGFQMSYAATIGLVAGYAAWRDWSADRSHWVGRRWRPVSAAAGFAGGILLSSLIGGVATLVYSIGHFHRIPAYGLAGNLLAMPIISLIIMPMAMVAMLLMPFGLDAIPLAIMGRGIEWIIVLAKWVSSWGGEVVTGRLSPLAFALIAAGGGLVCLFRSRLALVGLAPLLIGVTVAAVHGSGATPELLISEDGRLVAIISDRVAATNRTKPPAFIYDQWRRSVRVETHRPPVLSGSSTSTQQSRSMEAASTIARPEVTSRQSANVRHANHKIWAAERKIALGKAETERARADMRSALKSSAKEKRFFCLRKAWCAGVTPASWRVVTIEDPAYLGVACDVADFVVAPQFLRTEACRSGARLITAHSLRRTGALEIAPKAAHPVERTNYSIRPAVTTLDRPWTQHRLYDWRTGRYLPSRNAVSDSDE